MADGTTPNRIDVTIGEDQHDIRDGIAALIGGTPGYRCTGAFHSMEEALAGMHANGPHVALIDLGLPGMSGES
jgi:DNA-binding NarL/FixJ family response regulator